MIILKQVLHFSDTNTVEATWTQEATMTQDAGIIKCHSYADVQMQMFRDDAAQMGTDLTEHESLIALVESRIVPYVAPPPPKVDSVLMVQARKALILEGVSLIEIEAIIDKMPGIQRDLARADWDTAPTVHRDNALVAYIAGDKKWTSAFVDALFVKAAGIKA